MKQLTQGQRDMLKSLLIGLVSSVLGSLLVDFFYYAAQVIYRVHVLVLIS